MSLRRFQGWEPATRHEHDENGRLVASRSEPEWNDEQRAWLEALAAVEADECPGCRGSLEETTAQNERGAPATTYGVTAVRCYRCDALGKKQRDVGKDETAFPHTALLYRAHPTT